MPQPFIVERLQEMAVPVGAVREHPENPRQGDVGAITISLRAHGQYRPIVVQHSTGYVLAGNHTLKAMRSIGGTHIAAAYVDVDDDEARQIMLVDNRTAELATYDQDVLAAVLRDLAERDLLVGTGYTADDVDELLSEWESDITDILSHEFPPDEPGTLRIAFDPLDKDEVIACVQDAIGHIASAKIV